jgi:branched-chain amino acid transport system substrate-binding protein
MAEKGRESERQEGTDVSQGRSYSRREFLRVAGLAGATIGAGVGLGGLLAGCGAEQTTTTTAGATTTTGAASSTTTTAAASTTTVSAGPEAGREIKVGDVAPDTSYLNMFGVADQWAIGLAKKAIGAGMVLGDGKMHPISFTRVDTQSDSNRASQVSADLILNNKIDILIAAGTADTVNPAADQAETLGCPLIAIFTPWQTMVRARNQKMDSIWKWAWAFAFGADEDTRVAVKGFSLVPNNKKVGVLMGNDSDGIAQMVEPYGLQSAIKSQGYTIVLPGLYPPGQEDFTKEISEFKKAGCETVVTQTTPPDFSNYLSQALQQGFHPKAGSASLPLMAAESMYAMGDIAVGYTVGLNWAPTFPWSDSLTGMNGQQIAEDFYKTTGWQWNMLAGAPARQSWLIDVLKRAKNPEDKESIVEAISTTKLDTIQGLIDFTAPVDPENGSRVHHNICKPITVLSQWQRGTTQKYELLVVATEDPEVPIVAKMQEIQYS